MKFQEIFSIFDPEKVKIKNPTALRFMENPEYFHCGTDSQGNHQFFAMEMPEFKKEKKF